MKVKFLKYCPWSYRLTNGNLLRHQEGDIATVPDREGREMIRAGYAEQIKPGRPVAQPEQVKIVAPAETKPLDLAGMTKKALETLGRKYGIELDRRKKKSVLVKEIQGVIGGEDGK